MKPSSRNLLRPLLCAASFVALTTAGFAQSPTPTDQDDAAHHPPAAGGAAPAPNPAPATPNGAMGREGQGGMMMGGDMRQMMSMMRGMMTMMSAESGMMSPDVEGRIASLRTELKITGAQSGLWARFADALRDVARSMNEMHGQMMQPGPDKSLPARLERQEKMLASHAGAVRTLKDAVGPLYASFSAEQKKIADGLMIGPMGMM